VIIGSSSPPTTHQPQPATTQQQQQQQSFDAHQTPLSQVLVGVTSRDRWGRWVSRKLQEKGLSPKESDVVRALEEQLTVVVRGQVVLICVFFFLLFFFIIFF
jgi:hypothetical protein